MKQSAQCGMWWKIPNWIEGTLKLRGTKENIEKFLRNGIEYVDANLCKDENGKLCIKRIPREIEFKIDEDQVFIENTMDAYISGTQRMFINKDTINAWWMDKEPTIIVLDIRQAWEFASDDLVKLSKTWKLDFYAYGIEGGMEFCQIVEVVNGKLIQNKKGTFDDFWWECPDPRLGG